MFIHVLGKPQFELRMKKRDRLFCLAQRNSAIFKLLVKIEAMAINRHNNISRETCAIFDPARSHAKTPLVNFVI